jgi:hypothetical protein
MVIAHTGHWLLNLAYAVPVLVLVGWLGYVRAREALERRGVGKQPSRD